MRKTAAEYRNNPMPRPVTSDGVTRHAVTGLLSSWGILGSHWPWMVLVVAGVLAYGRILISLAGEWRTNTNYSHGFLVPIAVGYVLIQKRDLLLRFARKPQAWGMGVIVCSQIVLLAGSLGAEFFLQRMSVVIFLTGLILFLWGWQHLKELSFCLALIVLAIPLPAILFNAIALPLQLLASSWAESLLRICQIPVYREGNILQLSEQVLNVGEACSGIRSLVSLITLSLILAYFIPLRWWGRVCFVSTAVPIALAANALRIAGTALLSRWLGERAAQGFFHMFSGWLIFLFALGLLLGELTLLQKYLERRRLSGVSA